MGRRRSHNKHLPRRMQQSHGAFFHTAYAVVDGAKKKVWTPLGKDYGAALRKWAEIEGAGGAVLRTMQHVIGRYLLEEAVKRRPATLKGYEKNAKKLIPVFGRMLPEDIDPRHVREYLDRAGNVQSNRDIAMLSDVFRWANEMGLLPRDYRGYNPCANVRKNPEKPRERYVTDSEYWRLLRHSGTAQMRCVIALAYHTGLRQGDLLALRWQDVSDDGIAIRASKTGKRSLIERTPALGKLLKRIRALPRGVRSMHVFANREGQAYTGDGFRSMFARVKTRAKLESLQFRDVRRKSGSDIEQEHATKLLQHSSSALTKRVYRVKPERVKPVR